MNPLLWILQFAFGCHHGHLSRVFTIKKRTYNVCLDCGHEFGLPDAYPATSSGVADPVGARLKTASAPVF
jgi:hypothetical protein